MCSVEGYTGNHEEFSIEQYAKFNECRGPDGTDYYKDQYINLAHNLLAISPNETPRRQPWKMADGRYLVWNGEIFGLPDGTFDTEWLGDKICNESLASLKTGVDWMGAGVIYDPKNLKITLFRDHFGVKPLYYCEFEHNLYFSSTARPLYAVLQSKSKEIKKDKQGWMLFKHNDRHMFGTVTTVEGIRRLSPGSILTYDIRHARFETEDTFWGADRKKFTLDYDMMWTPKEMEEFFIKGIGNVCHAPGIPKTISLSGGLDSTLIASIARDEDDIDCQSVKYENFRPSGETINDNMMMEWDLAKKAARSFKLPFNTTKYPYDNNHLVEEGQFALSMSNWDRNRWTTRYANVKRAAERGRKIYIVGDGADELLTGYNGDYDYFNRRKKRPGLNKDKLKLWAQHDPKWRHLANITPSYLFGDDDINNRLFVRLLQHVDSFCTVVDHMCGNFGMESRMPFLSQGLAKYLLMVPSVYKLHVPFELPADIRNMYMGHYKGLIRDHMKQHLPRVILNRHSKIGFSTPWNARNDKHNQQLAEADFELLKYQATKYFNFDVDFKNDWKYDTKIDKLNKKVVEVNLEENNG